MRIRVKICGVTSLESARAAAEAGADAVGFVFAESPRRVTAEVAAEISAGLPPSVEKVAVFREPQRAEVEAVFARFLPDFLQCEMENTELLGFHRATTILPVFHDSPEVLLKIRRFLKHSPMGKKIHLEGSGRGGRGVGVDRDRAAIVAGLASLVLAGGLDPENVGEAIATVRPHGVDVSSGVESAPGVKEPARIREFIQAVRRAEAGLPEHSSTVERTDR